jgi:hypothetical protein
VLPFALGLPLIKRTFMPAPNSGFRIGVIPKLSKLLGSTYQETGLDRFAIAGAP